ncbi:MAG TPA: ParB/RepB/Spo0J family partition protein [Chloroflexota bacterium]|nr:ParB/RepB/Spo0J family partition protein [Chloroflexota bacterium]
MTTPSEALDLLTRAKRARPELDATALLVPLQDIVPRRPMRATWNQTDEALRQLTESIEEQGILKPLLVRELSATASAGAAGARRFELIAGFRRYAAAKQLGLARVPVRVVHAGEDEALALGLAENLHHRDLTEGDALRALAQLRASHGWPVRKIARAIGRSPSWVSERLAVARSDPERSAVEAGRIGLSAASRMVRLKEEFPELRQELLERIGAGERLETRDVPRLRQLRPQAGGHARAGAQRLPAELAGLSEEAGYRTLLRLSSAVREVSSLPRPHQAPRVLEVHRQELTLVRNMRTVLRQVLSTLASLWDDQGRERTLPPELREELRRSIEELDEFLARDPPPRE